MCFPRVPCAPGKACAKRCTSLLRAGGCRRRRDCGAAARCSCCHMRSICLWSCRMPGTRSPQRGGVLAWPRPRAASGSGPVPRPRGAGGRPCRNTVEPRWRPGAPLLGAVRGRWASSFSKVASCLRMRPWQCLSTAIGWSKSGAGSRSSACVDAPGVISDLRQARGARAICAHVRIPQMAKRCMAALYADMRDMEDKAQDMVDGNLF